jgi:hypothetical protein
MLSDLIGLLDERGAFAAVVVHPNKQSWQLTANQSVEFTCDGCTKLNGNRSHVATIGRLMQARVQLFLPVERSGLATRRRGVAVVPPRRSTGMMQWLSRERSARYRALGLNQKTRIGAVMSASGTPARVTSRSVDLCSRPSASNLGPVSEARFMVRKNGIIEVEVGVPGGALDHALNDAVTGRAPRGARHTGLSTYWVDRTERQLALAIENGTTEPFASGDVTYLRTDGQTVIAALDFDEDEATCESINVVSFIRVLAEWREHVIASGGVSGDRAADLSDDSEPIPLATSLIFDSRGCRVCANGNSQ